MNKYNFTLLLLFACVVSSAQEHITNGCFSNITSCPTDQDQLSKAKGWFNASATTYFFHECHIVHQNLNVGVPKNSWGNQIPYCGKGYTGINLDKYNNDIAIQNKIQYPLCKDSLYYVEFYVVRSEFFINRATSSFGVYFFSEKFPADLRKGSINLRNNNIPYVENDTNNIIYEKDKWIKISGTFKAKGGEQYMVIGNSKPIGKSIFSDFTNNPNLTKRKLKNYPVWSFYFLDGVSLWPIDSLGNKKYLYDMPQYVSIDSIELGKAYKLQTIQYNKHVATITAAAYPELDKIVAILASHPNLRLELYGHSSDSDRESDNIFTSEIRAKKIQDYLLSKGISAVRIKTYGYGSSKQPELQNSTDSITSNRKVEYSFIRE